MNPADFNLMFERFERSAFRLETRDTYDVSAETDAFGAFLSNGTRPRRSAETDPWLKLVSAQTARGKTMQRVRLFTTPQTDYTRFEFAQYEENVQAGEDIRLVDRSSLPEAESGWGDEDFWLFDEETVVLMHYDGFGAFIKPERVNEVESYLEKAQVALAASTSFPTSPQVAPEARSGSLSCNHKN